MLLDREKWAKIQELQKGTHLMSRIHKPLEDIIVYLLYDLTFISADHISVLTYILAAMVSYFFITQKIVFALILAVVVGILDGVDGKIARLRAKKTLIGKLEHSFDMLYEQAWYISFIWYLYTTTGAQTFLVLGFIWILSDSYVRHIYNTFWLATGKSLKYYEGLAKKVTFIDGRRSFYILHMIIWYLIGNIAYALYTILIHCIATAIMYTYLSFKLMHKTVQAKKES